MKQRGSVTVFLSMILTVMLSLEFSLVEVIHWYGLRIQGDRIATMAMENVFSEYNVPLWEKYGILAADITRGENSLRKHTDAQTEYQKIGAISALDLYALGTKETQISEYCLITDQEGIGFVKQGAAAAKGKLANEMVSQWEEQMKQMEHFNNESINVSELLSQGEEAMQQADSAPQDEEEKPSASTVIPENTPNPIEVVKQWREKGILNLVVDDSQEISSRVIETREKVSQRVLSQGTGTNDGEITVSDRLWFQLYLLLYFQNYQKSMEHEGLAYELEYVLCGQKSDQENLQAIVNRLLGIREIENYLAILKDSGKMTQAMDLAIHFAGASGNAAIIKAVQLGIAAAWAYMESILDIRLLLTGGKVAFIKEPSQWTSELLQLPVYLDVSIKAKECDRGLDYQTYLFSLLCLISQRELVFRSMDLMENELNHQEEYVNLKMDQLYYVAKSDSGFTGKPIFFSYMNGMNISQELYQFHQEKKLSYLDH